MKRISFIAILLFALGAMNMVSCQKDQETTRLQEPTTSTETADANGVSERNAYYATAGAACWGGSSCGSIGITNSKVNHIKINTNGNTIPSYGLTYRIFNPAGTKIHEFKCKNPISYYASTSLLNNTTYTVQVLNVNLPNVTLLATLTVTMGNFNGQPCFSETE